jgi:hypothetical protein
MKFLKQRIVIASLVVAVVILIFGIYQILFLRKAHSTFENYYAFRGCTTLIKKTNEYGICKTENGQTIKIVKFQDKWYLDGDLPCGFLCF